MCVLCGNFLLIINKLLRFASETCETGTEIRFGFDYWISLSRSEAAELWCWLFTGMSGWRLLSLVRMSTCMPTSSLESVPGTHRLASACEYLSVCLSVTVTMDKCKKLNSLKHLVRTTVAG